MNAHVRVCTNAMGTQMRAWTPTGINAVIIDEAGQDTEPGTLVAAATSGKFVILVGDHKQLPATLKSMFNQTQGRGTSLFQRLMEDYAICKVRLVKQHRMHPQIAAYPSHAYYAGTLISMKKWSPNPPGYKFPSKSGPVCFEQCRGEERSCGTSFTNRPQAERIVIIVKDLIKGGRFQCKDICVLTPYLAQAHLITLLLKEAQHSVAKVQTVDASQGDEHPVILHSSVCANDLGRIGFVGDARRLNVAITRAMDALIMLGDQYTLCKVDKESAWNPLFTYFAAQGWIGGKEGKRRSADVEVSTRNVAARKQKPESVPYTRRVTLGETDSKSFLAQARKTVSVLLQITTFRMLMTFVLGLPIHKYHEHNQPHIVLQCDRKKWSHLAEFWRVGVPPDATNKIYFCCVYLVVVTQGTLPAEWKTLFPYFAEILLNRGRTLQESVSHTRYEKVLNEVGDIFESIAGICMPEAIHAKELRERLPAISEKFHRDECPRVVSLLGDVATSIFHLSRKSAWTESDIMLKVAQGRTVAVMPSEDASVLHPEERMPVAVTPSTDARVLRVQQMLKNVIEDSKDSSDWQGQRWNLCDPSEARTGTRRTAASSTSWRQERQNPHEVCNTQSWHTGNSSWRCTAASSSSWAQDRQYPHEVCNTQPWHTGTSSQKMSAESPQTGTSFAACPWRTGASASCAGSSDVIPYSLENEAWQARTPGPSVPRTFKEHDDRFNKDKTRRQYVCDGDGCRNVVPYTGQCLPYDGQYLYRDTWTKVPLYQLKQAWMHGKLDVTWLCLTCWEKKKGKKYSGDRTALRKALGIFSNVDHRRKQWDKRSKGPYDR